MSFDKVDDRSLLRNNFIHEDKERYTVNVKNTENGPKIKILRKAFLANSEADFQTFNLGPCLWVKTRAAGA